MKTHLEIIQHYINKVGSKSYLELGIHNGNNFQSLNCSNKTGVDIVLPYPSNQFYQLHTDVFFTLVKDPYDVIFIDASHVSSQVDCDVSNAMMHLNEGGVILMHDVNPPNEVCTRVPRETREWCGDVFRSWHGLVTNFPELRVDFHPQDYGMAVIHYSDNIRPIPGFASDISYEDYKKWLHEKGWA